MISEIRKSNFKHIGNQNGVRQIKQQVQELRSHTDDSTSTRTSRLEARWRTFPLTRTFCFLSPDRTFYLRETDQLHARYVSDVQGLSQLALANESRLQTEIHRLTAGHKALTDQLAQKEGSSAGGRVRGGRATDSNAVGFELVLTADLLRCSSLQPTSGG